MNDLPVTPGKSGNPLESDLESRLTSIAQTFAYPPSPDVRKGVEQRLARRAGARRWRLTFAATLLLILAVLFAVPPVRAAILDWIQIGAVRIFTVQPTSTPTPTTPPGQTASPMPTGVLTPTPLTSVLDLTGETSLSQAQSQGFPLLLPAYPPDLGTPDHVYVQDFGGPVVMLVWMEMNQPSKVILAISETNINAAIFQKIAPSTIENTTVSGKPAIWVDAPYMLITGNGSYELDRLITTGHTLIWSDGQLTYRIETGDDLATAIKIAESLR